MSLESWRLSRSELRGLLDSYERTVDDDALNLLRPGVEERMYLGERMVTKRAEAVKKAKDANRQFVEAMIEDLPETTGGYPGGAGAQIPPRPICEFRVLSPGVSTLPTSSYGSIATVNLHLLRDWSSLCDHVGTTTYGPAVEELQRLLPSCKGNVLVPGAGLGRLALALAKQGWSVEANDASRLFLTVADYLLNRPPAAASVFPLAHLFTENWNLDAQYVEIDVPSPTPFEVAGVTSAPASPAFTFVPGDFVKTYGAGCVGHRKFDAIVTCFFIDTPSDVCEQFQVMDGLLAEGGVWLNIGPLNWRKETRLKLNYDEVVAIWERMGYEFVTRKRIDCDYHVSRGHKMYTESYNAAFTAAVKRRPAATD